MRVGITGFNGFIGKSLLKYLKSRYSEINVFCIDPRTEKIISNLDVIFHLGFSSPFKYQKNPDYCNKIDIDTAKKIYKYCQDNGSTLIYTSSASVYQFSNKSVDDEDVRKSMNIYGHTKFLVENFFSNNKNIFKLVILRLFNIYGANQNNAFVVPLIFESLKNNKKLVINNPNAKRDFLYIDDCLRVLHKSIYLSHNNYIMDVGTGKGVPIKSIVFLMSSLIKEEYKGYIKIPKNNLIEEKEIVANTKDINNYFPGIKFLSIEEGIQLFLSKNN